MEAQEVRAFDLVVLGSTGYSGQITCRMLAKRAPAGLRLGLAGRDIYKLKALKSELGSIASCSLDVVVSRSMEHDDLVELCSKTNVLCSFVGPYRIHGEAVVKACVEASTDYVDVTGEPPFYRDIVAKYHEEAAAKRLYIVPACGMGSLIADMAVELAKQAFVAEGDLATDTLAYLRFNGSFAKAVSNGTWNTLVHSMANRSARVERPMQPSTEGGGRRRPGPRASQTKFHWVSSRPRGWAIPFVETADLSVIRRTNVLCMGASGSSNFAYAQFILFAPVPSLHTLVSMLFVIFAMFLARFAFIRRLLTMRTRDRTGQGPTPDQRAQSSMEFIVVSRNQYNHAKRLKLHCPSPYSATGIACAEACLALATKRKDLKPIYGVVTPAAVMFEQLEDGLKRHEGVDWEVEVLGRGD